MFSNPDNRLYFSMSSKIIGMKYDNKKLCEQSLHRDVIASSIYSKATGFIKFQVKISHTSDTIKLFWEALVKIKTCGLKKSFLIGARKTSLNKIIIKCNMNVSKSTISRVLKASQIITRQKLTPVQKLLPRHRNAQLERSVYFICDLRRSTLSYSRFHHMFFFFLL